MKKIIAFVLVGISLMYSNQVCGQQEDIKGLYVNDFKYIIGDTVAENKLLQYSVDSGFNYLILYNLYYIHNNLFDITDPVTAAPLADFLKKAYSKYGILEIAAVGETFNSFATIHDYNMDHMSDAQQIFNVYNIEYEFWNSGSTGPGGYYCTTYLSPGGYSCDTAGAFDHYYIQIARLDSLTDSYAPTAYIKSETYIGSPTDGQCTSIADTLDRVLVHYYRSSDVYVSGASIYTYKESRMPALAEAGSESQPITMMPIFNCESSFMGPWLTTNSIAKPYDTWLNGTDGFLSHVADDWYGSIESKGYVWYRYSCMPDTPLSVIENKIEHLRVYPNPTIGLLNIHSQFYNSSTSYTIYSMMGNIVQRGRLDQVLDFRHLSSGFYYILIEKENYRGVAIVEKL